MTNHIKVIRTDEDYQGALAMIGELIAQDPDPDSEDGEKLSLLATLIQDYESKTLPESLPDPIDAILFRMEQQSLKPSDLVPYIGSRSKVSEILARKRPLTLSMIRSLESGLGIPAKVLLKESDDFRDTGDVAWNRYPFKEMEKRGYFGEAASKIKDAKTAIEKFFLPLKSQMHFAGMLRKTNFRSIRPMDKYALVAWSARVIQKADSVRCTVKYKEGVIDLAFMQKVAQISAQEDGPVVVQEFLKGYGIALVIEPHLPQTYLDGATFMEDKERPIIGLTIRMDRIDNFWFTLMHELAHIALHYNQECQFFYDDLDNPDPDNEREKEADALALEALVPRNKWENSPAKLVPSPLAAESLAKELKIHTAIVAGKMRHEGGRYMYLSSIVNQAKARHYFTNETWFS